MSLADSWEEQQRKERQQFFDEMYGYDEEEKRKKLLEMLAELIKERKQAKEMSLRSTI